MALTKKELAKFRREIKKEIREDFLKRRMEIDKKISLALRKKR